MTATKSARTRFVINKKIVTPKIVNVSVNGILYYFPSITIISYIVPTFNKNTHDGLNIYKTGSPLLDIF